MDKWAWKRHHVFGVRRVVSRDNTDHMPTLLSSSFLLISRKCSVKAKCANRCSREPDLYPATEPTCGCSLMLNYEPEQKGADLSWFGDGAPWSDRCHTTCPRSHVFGLWEHCLASINLPNESGFFLLNLAYPITLRNT